MDEFTMQSVFDNATEVEKEFDTIFGGEEDDDLIGMVLGEAADDADFETLDDGTTPDELKKEVEGEESKNQPTADSNGEFDIKDDNLGNLGCDKFGVADAVEKEAPNEENIKDEIEKSENKVDFEDEAFVDAILGEGDEECNNDECKDGECEEKPAEETEEPVVSEPEAEESPAPEVTVPEEEEKDLDDELAEEDDDDDIESEEIEVKTGAEAEDDDVVVQDAGCKKEEANEIPAAGGEEGSDPTAEENVEESADLDDILAEGTDEEDVEDEIIDSVENDDELSKAELDELIEDDDDDALIDVIMGE